MSLSPTGGSAPRRWLESYHRALCAVVKGLAFLAGISLLFMVILTTMEVGLRIFRISFTGAYDLVKITAALTLAAALPYTTAIKGHVAIEFFFHKLGRRGRTVVDALMRMTGIALFSLLTWGCIGYGNSLRARGEVSMTLQLPVFWVPYVLAGSCALVVLVKLYHLTHPGKSMLRP